MPLNPFYANIFIDSCAFDPKYEPETSSSQEIFGRYEDGDINLIISHSNLKEAEHPNTPSHVKKEAQAKIFTLETKLTEPEKQKKSEIWSILTGNGHPEKMEQDANHVFEAHKYGGYFVTTDKRILKFKEALQEVCNSHIVLPSELVKLING